MLWRGARISFAETSQCAARLRNSSALAKCSCGVSLRKELTDAHLTFTRPKAETGQSETSLA